MSRTLTIVAALAAVVAGAARAEPEPAPLPTAQELAAAALARSVADSERLAPAVARSRVIARDVGRRYGLPVAEVATTLPVASLELVLPSGAWRSVAADNGIYFALCGRGTEQRCAVATSGRARGAVAARRQALELARRTFAETPVSLVVVSLPQRGALPVLLVIERSSTAREARTLFRPAGLIAVSDWREALLVVALP